MIQLNWLRELELQLGPLRTAEAIRNGILEIFMVHQNIIMLI